MGFRDEMSKDKGDILVQCMYNILFLNDIVCGAVVDMCGELKHSHIYRHEIKREADKVNRERKRYESMMHDIVKAYESDYADMNDTYTELLSQDLMILRVAVKDYLDKSNKENSGLLSHIYYTTILSKLSCEVFDNRREFAFRAGALNSQGSMDYLRLTSLAQCCKRLADSVGYSDDNKPCDKVQLALDVLINKLADGERVKKAIV